VTRGVETFGGSGQSLVQGVMTKLSAVVLSVKAERSLRKLRIKGSLITHGPGVAPLELQGGIESLQVEDEAIALGQENAGSINENKLMR
jgi:hypothetical protein